VPVGTASGQRVAKVALNPHELFETTQHGYAQIVVVAVGMRTIYIAGQVGMSQAGPNDFKS